MLIVNADDMGASPSTTDPVLECFAAGAITSTSAMVWMDDTARAAERARERGLPVGLHLNLTMAYNADQVPADVRQRQLAVTQRFDPDSWRGRDDRPVDAALVAAAIADQLGRFRELFGEPSHIDGHHHIHLHPAVLAALPRSLPIRPPLSPEGATSLGQRWLLRRFKRPDRCLAFVRVHPALGGEGLDVLSQARQQTIEVMVHPAQTDELAALRSADWLAALAEVPLGSYRELAS
jgi:chitin disaccharide deacetylase